MEISRRQLALSASGVAISAFGAYTFGVEPMATPRIVTYRPVIPRWPRGERLKIACLADLHAGEPFAGLSRTESIVARINAERPDLIVLLGDYAATHHFLTADVPPEALAAALSKLNAPLGRFAILGNHDYWGKLRSHSIGDETRARGNAAIWSNALAGAGIKVLANTAARIAAPAGGLWLAGTESILSVPLGGRRFRGFDDLDSTLASAFDGAPVILLAHEPDLFVRVPKQVSLTLSGHTHGGQVRLPLIGSPWIPSRFGERFRYGHIVEDSRHLIVSAGIGMSGLPARFRSPPEITMVELGA